MNVSVTFSGELGDIKDFLEKIVENATTGAAPKKEKTGGKPPKATTTKDDEEDTDLVGDDNDTPEEITDVDLRAAIAPIQKDKKDEILALLAKYKVKRAGDLPQEKRAAFLKAIEKLS